jgi:hypothetical protein
LQVNGASAACAASKPNCGSTPPAPSWRKISGPGPLLQRRLASATTVAPSINFHSKWGRRLRAPTLIPCRKSPRPAPAPTPATRTIHTRLREFGFVPSKSENPASRRPQNASRPAFRYSRCVFDAALRHYPKSRPIFRAAPAKCPKISTKVFRRPMASGKPPG